MKVDQILQVWSLLSPKKNYFIKIDGTKAKKVHGLEFSPICNDFIGICSEDSCYIFTIIFQ
jgi:hypothetical protein